MLTTVSTRDLQRTPKKVIEEANRSQKPLIVISENTPQAAIISLDLLDKLIKKIPEAEPVYDMGKLNALAKEALEESKRGKTKVVTTPEEYEKWFREIEEQAE